MRYVLIIVLLFACLVVVFRMRGVALRSGGVLSAVERENVVAIHPDFARWEPSQSAQWVRHGVTRHVCIQGGGIGSLTMPYAVFVFDTEGGVIEANIINAPNPSTPKRVISVSPLRVAFERDSRTVVCSGEFSESTGIHDIRNYMDLPRRLPDIEASWRRSGSTNFEVLMQAIRSAITNSQK